MYISSELNNKGNDKCNVESTSYFIVFEASPAAACLNVIDSKVWKGIGSVRRKMLGSEWQWS
jgi:hypothetical protein